MSSEAVNDGPIKFNPPGLSPIMILTREKMTLYRSHCPGYYYYYDDDVYLKCMCIVRFARVRIMYIFIIIILLLFSRPPSGPSAVLDQHFAKKHQ